MTTPTGEDKLKRSLHRLRRVALGPTAAEIRQELQATAQEQLTTAPPAAADMPALQQILARLDALEKSVSEMQQGDARLLRAALGAAALLLIEMLSK